MEAHQSQLGIEEFLMRRIPSGPSFFDYLSGKPNLNAFLPGTSDEDGLSLYREHVEGVDDGYMKPRDLLDKASNDKTRVYGGVAVVRAGDVESIPLELDPDEGDSPGHVSCKQMNLLDYKNSQTKKQIKIWADLLVACVVKINGMRILPKPIQ